MSNRQFALILGCLILLAIVGISWLSHRQTVTSSKDDSTDDATMQANRSRRVYPKDYIQHGGVYRPQQDVVERKAPSEYKTPFKFRIGTAPKIAVDTNEQTRSLKASRFTKDAGKQYSALIPATKFDRKKYEANPDSYLSKVEPGRIWESLPPGTGKPIQRKGKYFHEVVRGESVIVRAITEPGMPVHFYTNSIGQFDNQLSTITVKADEQGIAVARYRTTSGQLGDVDLFAASPVRSGRTRYLVRVSIPD